jgi:hypothetical protein
MARPHPGPLPQERVKPPVDSRPLVARPGSAEPSRSRAPGIESRTSRHSPTARSTQDESSTATPSPGGEGRGEGEHSLPQGK